MVSRAARDVQAKFLLRNGADKVVYPERQLAKWTAIRYSSDHLLDYVELEDDYAIFEVDVPAEWNGKTVGEINIRKRFNVTLMAIRENGELQMSINSDTMIRSDQTLMVLGHYQDMKKCFHT